MQGPGSPVTASLRPHPGNPASPVQRIEVRIDRAVGGLLRLSYDAEGDWELVRLDQPGIPRRADELWRHTCFEAFVAEQPGTAYQEYNFACSLAWASYRFADYRRGMRIDTEATPALSLRRTGRQLLLCASMTVPMLRDGALARLGLAAVIETTDGGLCYWALGHAPGAPDFHHANNRSLQI